MRIFFGILTALLTIVLVVILNSTFLTPLAMGKFLSPQEGFWQNAEATDHNFSEDLHFPQLEGKASVYFDERLVPHVFAETDRDVYFIQGFLHAKFRLWQMDLQTRAAAGRISEILGDDGLDHDRKFRRLGMVFGAENSLREMEKDPVTKATCDAYTQGVNAFIETLTASQLPLEYKLMNFKPEPWSNFRTALFLKYMSYDLASGENDFEMTNAKSFFSKEDFDLLYPPIQDSLDPIIPRGTVYSAPGVVLTKPANADSIYFRELPEAESKPDKDNGSNNWAVSGSKTATGFPILCNDPHLGLNLPSLWYEMQLTTPNFSSYGATFPGSPNIIIGYNEKCAWGFTNGGRDVKDYYEISFKDDERKSYRFNNQWLNTSFRIEQIRIKGKPDYTDTVAYTIMGPVMYDTRYAGKRSGGKGNYAVRWKAHDPSNELMIFYKINRATNYDDYLAAASHLLTPGQNIVFASKQGDIALRTQGQWPAKWEGQGDFIMPGTDSSFLWQGMIPENETPYQYNPERNFVSSANQRPTDASYPYFLGRDYPSPRGLIINRMLTAMNNITPADMMKMQVDNYNVFAEMARPVFEKNIDRNSLSSQETTYMDKLMQWNLRNDPDAEGATIFVKLWQEFKTLVYNDEMEDAPKPIMTPQESTLLEAVLRDSTYKFLDNIKTTPVESIRDISTQAFKNAIVSIDSIDNAGNLAWGKYKNTRVNHLSRLPALSRLHLPIGGGTHIINATKETHGPSWRMVISLTPETEAYAIYPGGQSGNPGSRFYDDFIDDWAVGKYNTLWYMKKEEVNDKRIIGAMHFSKS